VERWVGSQGMGSIVARLAEGLDIRQDVWVPPNNGIQRSDVDGAWGVLVPKGRGKHRMHFDAVVIAHNGKCADRLTSNTPAQKINALLQTNFADNLPQNPRPGTGRFTLNQVYSLLIEVPHGLLPSNFDAAFIENEPSLRWLSSNSAKMRLEKTGSCESEVWTALSSAPFGKQHKAPQEFLEGTPKEVEVTALLLRAIERAVGMQEGKLQNAVLATTLQLWGAGLPINRWVGTEGCDFVWSGDHKIGIAGDWLSPCPARASTIEAAWLSGVNLAGHLVQDYDEDAGLDLGESGGTFIPVEGEFGRAGSSSTAWVTEPSKGSSRTGWTSERGGRKGGRRGAGKGRGNSWESSGDQAGKGDSSASSTGRGGQGAGAGHAKRWTRRADAVG